MVKIAQTFLAGRATCFGLGRRLSFKLRRPREAPAASPLRASFFGQCRAGGLRAQGLDCRRRPDDRRSSGRDPHRARLRGMRHRPHGGRGRRLGSTSQARSCRPRPPPRRRWFGNRDCGPVASAWQARRALCHRQHNAGRADNRGRRRLSLQALSLRRPFAQSRNRRGDRRHWQGSPAISKKLPGTLASYGTLGSRSMNDEGAKVGKLLRQQTAIARFGSFGLRESDLLKVLTEAARVCAESLSVPFAKVCRYRAAKNDLLIEAGHGWNVGVIGTIESADPSSPQGRAFVTGEPSICNDVRKDNSFELPGFYAAHSIVSTVDVVIHAKEDATPYGVLEIDNDQQHDYDQHDIDFLTGFANVLAEAVATSARTGVLQRTIERMKVLVEEKDRLLEQKKVLAEELQHRVRNNLQLVYGMLSKQLGDTPDAAGQRGIKAISRRVSTLAQVYDHLLGSEMTRTTDFGSYVRSLCLNLAEIQAAPGGSVTLTCDSDAIVLDLDVVTALGIVVAEVVTNSYDHAFPDGKRGSIVVSVRRADDDMATMRISDDGTGFLTKAESKRHGLGLVRRLVEQIRGSAVVNSDHGTMWTIKIPVAHALAS